MKEILIAEDDKILFLRFARALEKHGDVIKVSGYLLKTGPTAQG